MFSKLNNGSLVDNQIRMNLTLCPIYLTMLLFFDSNFARFLTTVVGLLASNWPLVVFYSGVRRDSGWILSIIGIERNRAVSKTKSSSLQCSEPIVAYIFILLTCNGQELTLPFLLKLLLMLFSIYFISRLITQIMGFYIYWIAKMSNDAKLKTNAPDDTIIDQSLKAAKLNYGLSAFLILILFISLAVYLFVECTFPVVQPSIRSGFILYSILVFFWIVFSLILGQLFDKNVVLLHSIQQGFIDKQFTTIKEIFPKRLFLMKFVLALFLFWEMVILPVVIRIVL